MIARKIALAAAGATLVASAVFASAASAKKEPQVLQASSNWNLDYAEKKCRLSRTFGDGYDKVVLIMDQSRPGDAFSMTVAGKPIQDLRLQSQKKVELQFGPGEGSWDAGFSMGDLGSYRPALIFGVIDFRATNDEESELAAEAPKPGSIDLLARGYSIERTAQIEWLQLRSRSAMIRLATGPMDVPIAGMQTCLEDLALHWGIDVSAHRTLSRLAKPANKPGEWIRTSDYPPEAHRSGDQAILSYRITVGSDGAPTDCEIVRLTNATEFDAISCRRMMERARFDPALDAQGQPIKSVFFGTIRFVTPTRS